MSIEFCSLLLSDFDIGLIIDSLEEKDVVINVRNIMVASVVN